MKTGFNVVTATITLKWNHKQSGVRVSGGQNLRELSVVVKQNIVVKKRPPSTPPDKTSPFWDATVGTHPKFRLLFHFYFSPVIMYSVILHAPYPPTSPSYLFSFVEQDIGAASAIPFFLLLLDLFLFRL